MQRDGILFLVLCLSVLRDGAVAVPLAEFYPFGIGAMDTLLPGGDDNISPSVSLSPAYNVFGNSYSIIYVSCKCNIVLAKSYPLHHFGSFSLT